MFRAEFHGFGSGTATHGYLESPINLAPGKVLGLYLNRPHRELPQHSFNLGDPDTTLRLMRNSEAISREGQPS